jgi:hypothetical protein
VIFEGGIEVVGDREILAINARIYSDLFYC